MINEAMIMAGLTDKELPPTEENEVVRANLLLCIEYKDIVPLFAAYLKRMNGWSDETSTERALEFLEEFDKTID